MPRHEDIEQFKRVLASYGAGPAGRAGTSTAGGARPAAAEVEAEPVETPDELGDLSDLGDAGEASGPGMPETPDEGAPPDIGDLLSSLGGELGGGSSAEPVQGEENLDLSALFGEEESRAIAHQEEPEVPVRYGRQKRPKSPRPPKQPKERRAQRAEPEPSPEEEEALVELAAPLEEVTPPEELPPVEEPGAPLEEPAASEELAAPEELPTPDEWPAPEEEPAAPLEETAAPFLEEAEPVGEPPVPTEPEELPETPPEFLEPVGTAPEAEAEAGPTAEEALLKPLEGAEEIPSLTGDLDQFSVLPDETAPAEPESPVLGAPEDLGPTDVEEISPEIPITTSEPDLSSLEPGVTHADLPDIGGLDELTLQEEGAPAPAPPRTDRTAARPAPRAEQPRRGPPPRVERPARGRPVRAEAAEPAGPGAAPSGAAETAIPGSDIQLTDEQFSRLRRTLGILPRNLKIAVQDIVAGAASPTADLAALIGLLVSGAGPKEIAALAGKITGKRIRIPAAYERRTGLAFEREQRMFAYAFRQNILPLVRLFVLAVVGAGLAGFLGYRFVWQPLSANANYRRGYEQLEAGRYPLANERFARAARAWPMRRWYFRYAEGFKKQEQYALAAEKYEQMLGRWPNDRKAVLDWAAMESKQRMRFEQADEILHRILDRKPTDYDALLAAGDNFLEWAGEEPTRYEDARLSWAELMKAHGQRDEVLFRMLRYFVRTDNLEEAERLRSLFFDRRRFSVNTEAARSLAELGGYLVDKRQLDWVHDILLKAADGAPDLPDVSYQLARFYHAMEQPRLEEQWLSNALLMMERSDGPHTPRDVGMQIDAQTRLGELYYGEEKYLDASRELRKAVALVDKQVRGGVITAEVRRRQPRLGRLLGRPYAKLADISYYIEGVLADAADGYRTAAGYGYTGSEIDYKLGYISYAGGEWLTALEKFSDAEEGLASAAFAAPGDEAVGAHAASAPGRAPINLLFAQGNAFFRRGDLFAAQGSWLRVLEAVETRLAAIDELSPFTRPDQRALLEYRMKANNNLGVATAQLAGRTGDRRRTSEALAYLASAAETADLLARAPETLVATEAKSLPALNMRGVLYPLANFELQIYKAIPKDLEAASF
jgi:tetratricopeptide (TPR) repeat protein